MFVQRGKLVICGTRPHTLSRFSVPHRRFLVPREPYSHSCCALGQVIKVVTSREACNYLESRDSQGISFDEVLGK